MFSRPSFLPVAVARKNRGNRILAACVAEATQNFHFHAGHCRTEPFESMQDARQYIKDSKIFHHFASNRLVPNSDLLSRAFPRSSQGERL